MLGVDPMVYYWTTPRELASMIRGREIADNAALGRIRLAVWGEAKDIKKAIGKGDTMTPAEYADLVREIEGTQPEA